MPQLSDSQSPSAHRVAGRGHHAAWVRAWKLHILDMMIEMRGADAYFLWQESRALHMHTLKVVIVAPPPDGREPVTIDRVREGALARLDDLLRFAAPLVDENTVCIFHKGQDFVSEIDYATQYWDFEVDVRPSITDPTGRILVLRTLRPHREPE